MRADPAEIVLADHLGHRASRDQRIDEPPGGIGTRHAGPCSGRPSRIRPANLAGNWSMGEQAGNGDKPVDVDQQPDPVRRAVRRAGGGRPAVAGGAQHHVPQALELENRNDVVDVHAKADRFARR